MTREEVYDQQINPLMSQIIEICKQNRIPIAATFELVEGGDADPMFCTTLAPFDSRNNIFREFTRWVEGASTFAALAITIRGPEA